ncbi:MAG: hypothetical protein U9O89_07500 [Thermoproteota archaeon]|nr:hypothetical protein [Thermoproteota archaeon]
MKVLLPGELEPQSRLCNIFTLRVLRKLGLEESKPTVGDKIVELKKWILKNKDEDGLFGEPKLTKQIESLGLPVQRIIEKLLQDRIIEKSPKIGKFIVVK